MTINNSSYPKSISILGLSSEEARNYFLKEESYFNLNLPDYFTFSKILSDLSNRLTNTNLSDFFETKKKPSDYENVNYKIFSNKNGKYAWRPFSLIHPALYVSLVHKITEYKNWEEIKNKFKEFKKENKIECVSLPIKSKTTQSNKAQQITNWVQEVEQKSIELSLYYTYLYHTDIADCYGSIYTHSIPWALHTKKVAKNDKTKSLIGNAIDQDLQSMSHGQTNGIPQGSTLMDFIAEIVLGYADLLLSNRIEDIKDYKIIRFRDDYRIFVNNPSDAEKIIKSLTEVLIELGLKLNDKKTIHSDNIIRDSIKPDKLYWAINNKIKLNKSITSKLYVINDIAEKFPNSGSVNKQLQKIYREINTRKKINENTKVLIAIIANIAFKNPSTYPISIAIISNFFGFLRDDDERKDIAHSLIKKFDQLPNTGHLKIWLQRMTITIDNSINYDENLCKKVLGLNVDIWNSEWLQNNIKSTINSAEIIDKSKIDSLDRVISPKEVILYNDYYES